LGILVPGVELAASLLRKKLSEAGVEIGDVGAMEGAGIAEIDEAIERQRTAVVRQLAGFQ
jgi:hypothetical protein